MTRILADLPVEDVAALDLLAARNGRSRAAEIREAVELYLRRRADRNWIRRGQGYWKDRAEIGDGVKYQRRMREDRGAS
ncbi:MAG TPA: ribbon-helix-helix protein, CopG family [Croceibacterium sp.]|nr:ribbon-helix-helix protein, CopG family [Croceibacterium sp.]